jgi:hypothetical protein
MRSGRKGGRSIGAPLIIADLLVLIENDDSGPYLVFQELEWLDLKTEQLRAVRAYRTFQPKRCWRAMRAGRVQRFSLLVAGRSPAFREQKFLVLGNHIDVVERHDAANEGRTIGLFSVIKLGVALLRVFENG